MPNTENMHRIELKVLAPKKRSGKYVVVGTENNAYPTCLYLLHSWLGIPPDETNPRLPRHVNIYIEPLD